MGGLTAAGFDRERLVDIKARIETALKLVFGENIDVTPESGFGQFIGIISETISDQWEGQEDIYNALYPSTAQSNPLSNVVTLNGIERLAAAKSTILSVTITGTSGTVIPAASQASVAATGDIFVTDVEVTIPVGGSITVDMTALNTGPVESAIGTLTVIETPIFGWTSVNNLAAAIVGRDEETDAELRIRRAASTGSSGTNIVDALFGQLSNLDGVTDALVISNGTSGVVDGIPAHEFEVSILGGDDDEIAETIWDNTPAGIRSHGDTTVVITDAQGISQNTKFTRPSEVDIYFKVDISVTADYPGASAVQDAVVAYGAANFKIGDDVIMSEFYTPINSVAGITAITLFMGLSASPATTANLTIDNDEISDYLASRVEVNIV